MRWTVAVISLGLWGCGPTVVEGDTEVGSTTLGSSGTPSPSGSGVTTATTDTAGPVDTGSTAGTSSSSSTSDPSSTTVTFITDPDGCFAAGTLVATPRGDRAIETLRVGDPVYAYDVEAGVRVVSRVEARFVHPATPVLNLALGDRTLWVTGNHPIYQPSTGHYVRADRIEAGDAMLAWDGTGPREREVAMSSFGDVRVPVYNISVAGLQNYFAEGVLVHNKSIFECDLFAQDCAEGDKCTPWSNDGSGMWNSTRCVPVADNPGQPGEECIAEESGSSGVDDCDLGSMCWDVDAQTLQGTCVALCGGDDANPICADGERCVIANDGYLVLCLPLCDPLVPGSCAAGETCGVIVDHPVCAQSTEGIFTPCVQGLCQAGEACVPAMEVPDCGADICCTPWCDLTAPDPDLACAASPMTSCQPYYGPGEAPAGLDHLGVCTLPA